MALTGIAYTRLLRHVAKQNIAGGRTYDAVIAECAAKARAASLLTLDEEHFRQWENKKLESVVPHAQSRRSE